MAKSPATASAPRAGRKVRRAAPPTTLARMPELLPTSAVHVGAVRGRYFRENFAQGGIDLMQTVPELVTNADAAIAESGPERERIELRFGAPADEFHQAWRAQMRALRVPRPPELALRGRAARTMASESMPPPSIDASVRSAICRSIGASAAWARTA